MGCALILPLAAEEREDVVNDGHSLPSPFLLQPPPMGTDDLQAQMYFLTSICQPALDPKDHLPHDSLQVPIDPIPKLVTILQPA